MNEHNLEEAGKGIMSVIVRCVGLFLLLTGVYVALQVMLKAVELYEKPQVIERFASAIEKGSNIDKSLSSIRDSVQGVDSAEPSSSTGAETGSSSTPVTTATPAQKTPGNSDVRISYFFAWIIMLMLLMLIGSISLRAIKTGGELVLYDMQIKQFARMLVRESGKVRDQ